MLQIKRMHLINWHYISETTAVFGKHVNFITGDNASGKSTLLDALQTALFVHSKDFNLSNQINKSRGGARDARQLMDYMRGTLTISTDISHLNLEKGQKYLRPHAVRTWIAVELFDDVQSLFHVVAFTGEINSDSVDDSSILKHWMWLDGRLDNYPMTVDETGGKRIISFREFKALHTDGEYYDTQKAAKLKLSVHYGLTRKSVGDEKAFNHMVAVELKALTFNPQNMKDTDTFLKETIFEDNPLDVSSFQHTLKEAKSVRETLENLENQQKELSRIKEGASLWEKADKEKSISEISALIVSRDSIEETLEQTRKQQNEEERKARNIQKQIDDLNEQTAQITALKAEVQRDAGTDILTSQEAALQKELGISIQAAERLDKAVEYTRKLAAKAKECGLKCDNSFFEQYQSSQQYFEGEQEASKRLLDGIHEAVNEAENRVRKCEAALSDFSVSLSRLAEEREGLKTGVSTSENDQKVLQAVKDAYRNLGIDDEPEYLFNKVECTDPSWTQAAEARLGRMLYAIVVKPEHYKDAFHAYRDLARKDKYLSGTVLLNTARLDGIVPRKGSLASVLKADDHNLQNYLCYRYNGTMLVDDATECADDIGPTAYLDRQRMIYSGHNLTRLAAKPSILGHKAKEKRVKDLLEKEKKLLDQATTESEAKKKLLSFLAMARSEMEYHDLNANMILTAAKVKECKDKLGKLEEKKKHLLNGSSEEKLAELEAQLDSFRVGLTELAEKLKEANMSAGSLQSQVRSLEAKLQDLNESIKDRKNNRFFADASAFAGKDKPGNTSIKEYIRLLRKKAALAEEEMAKQNTILASLESCFNTQYGTRFETNGYMAAEKYIEKLNMLENDSLPDLKSRFNIAEKQAEKELYENIVSGLKARIQSANDKIDELNAIIGTKSYASNWYQLNHVRPADGRERYFEAIMNWDSSVGSKEQEERYKDALNSLCINFEDGQASPEWYDWRYYCSFSMSVFSSADRDRNGDMGSLIEKGSGAEVQIPWYIVLGTALINAFSSSSRMTIRKSESLRLMMIDEVFDKMDKSNMQLMIEMMTKEMGLQMIVAAPSDRYERFGSTIEQIVYMKTENTNRQCFNFTAEDYDHEIRRIEKQE